MKRPTWPDGTPKSIANSFSGHKTGERSIFATQRRKPGPKSEREVLANKHNGYYSRAGVQ